MDEHKKFLADRLLSEEQPITYRLLSRALEVHVNTAKRMLYDFHQYQNALRAGSVHATYLVYGVKSAKTQHENGDVGMSSSIPEPESSSEAVPTHTLTLVCEENLEALLREYQDVTSIHVYSLSPRPQTDVALLADIASSTSDIYRQNGPILATNKYGVITNPSVRRRDPAARHAPSAVGAPKPVKQEKVAEKPAPAPKVKQEVVEKSSANPTPSSSSGKGPAPVAKRGGAGGIMQSFAKAASKPPPKPKQPVKKEDTSVAALSDDGEADDADMPSSRKAYTAAPDAARKSKKEREENLRRMMDEDDDDDVDEKDDEPDDEEMDDAPEPEPEPEPEAKPKEEPAEVISSSENGRRRGKRRIMKKKRILDDQGYMVTIQEPGWESFSEDDTPLPPAKATPASTPSSSGAKAKKPGGKKDQGNIMSFFSKK